MNTRSVEYKISGGKLVDPKQIVFKDKKGIGRLPGSRRDLAFFGAENIKRVRLICRDATRDAPTDGYYCQFCVRADNEQQLEPTGKTYRLDVGLKAFYTDSNGYSEPNPRFDRKSEKRLKRFQRRVGSKKKGSAKLLSTRIYICQCGCRLDREENAAHKIWELVLSTVGHTETSVGETGNASGDWSATVAGESLFPQDESLKEESASGYSAECQVLVFSKWEGVIVATASSMNSSASTVELRPSYKLPLALVVIAVALVWWQIAIASAVGLFGLFLAFQAATIRLQFTDSALDVYRSGKLIRQFPYSDWQNWRIFWSKVPILFYFKEVKSIHFVPVLFDARTLRSCLEQKCPIV